MAKCESLTVCPFFQETLPRMPATTAYLKTYYCQYDFEACARYKVKLALGKQYVPTDLFPDEGRRAARIIQEARMNL